MYEEAIGILTMNSSAASFSGQAIYNFDPLKSLEIPCRNPGGIPRRNHEDHVHSM